METKKKVLLVAILLCSSIATTVILAQEMQQIENINNATNTLPKKAKLKTIKYKVWDYAIVGYVYKNQFIEGQEIIVYNTVKELNLISVPLSYVGGTFVNVNSTKLKDVMISGVYSIKDEISCLETTVTRKNNQNENTIIKGIFKVTNDIAGKRLITETKNATFLNLEIVDLISYQGYYTNKKEPLTIMSLLKSEATTRNQGYSQILSNLSERTEESGRLSKHSPLTLQKKANNNYELKIEFDDRSLETIISSDTIMKYGFFAFDEFIKNSADVKLNYNNGNTFIGIVEKKDNLYVAKNGEYRFKTGDVYTGIIGNNIIYLNGRVFIPDQGKTIFADGTVADGDWLKQYSFTDNEWNQIYSNNRSLTEIRDAVIRMDGEKQKKIQEEKINKERTEREKLTAEKERKQRYISKYGKYYGTLISKGELTFGMNQTMVNEVWNKKFFNLSKAVYSNLIIEIWEFDKKKMQLEITKEFAKSKENEARETALAAIVLMDFSGLLFGEPSAPKMLIFKNNKLTEIYK